MSKATDILLGLKAPAVLSSDQITELKESWLAAQGKAEDATKENYLLRAKLTKANERVAELELESMAFRSILDQSNRHHPDTDKMYSSGFNDAMRLFEDIYLGEPHHALNKFAIEQQRKGIEDYKKSDEFCRLLDSHFNSGKVYGHNEYYEQLRKEQE